MPEDTEITQPLPTEHSRPGLGGIRTLLETFFIAGAAAIAWEIVKVLALPHLTMWQSHGLTIVFIGAAAVISQYAALYRRARRQTQGEARFQLLFADNPLPMWVYDVDTLRFLEVNDAAIARYGYSRTEFLQLGLADIRPAEDIALLNENLARPRPSLADSGPWRHRLKDGRIIDVQITSHLLEWGGRNAALVVVEDISERKRSEEALRETEERFRTAFEKAPFGMCLAALDGRFLQVNAALCQMLGYSRHELLAGAWQNLTHPDDLEVSRRAAQQMLTGAADSMELEKRYIHKRGNVIWVRMKISPVKNHRRETSHFISHVEDITERKRAETVCGSRRGNTGYCSSATWPGSCGRRWMAKSSIATRRWRTCSGMTRLIR